MSGERNRRLIVTSRPTGLVDDSFFELREEPVPEPGPGEFVVRNRWLGFDAAQRVFLDDTAHYGLAVPLGEVMWGIGLGDVVTSQHDGFATGDVVHGWFGWQDYALTTGRGTIGSVSRVPDGVSPELALSVLGVTGLTGYVGLRDIGRPVAGEVVAVTAAAGATGSVAVQVARIMGCTTIGIAGSPEKCRWLTDVAGVDHAIDYRQEDVAGRLAEVAPGGVDVCFDNVGGPILDAILPRMAPHGRVVVCGEISTGYDDRAAAMPGLRNYVVLTVKRLRMEGFVIGDHVARFDQARADLRRWVDDGELVMAVDVVHGLAQAPTALRRLFEGKNLGKQLLQITD